MPPPNVIWRVRDAITFFGHITNTVKIITIRMTFLIWRKIIFVKYFIPVQNLFLRVPPVWFKIVGWMKSTKTNREGILKWYDMRVCLVNSWPYPEQLLFNLSGLGQHNAN